MMRVFLDTNILVDVLERRQPFFLASANILELGVSGVMEMFVSSLTFINAIYIGRKSLGREVVVDKIKALHPYVHVSPMGEQEFAKALQMTGKDVEDNLQYCSALAAGCDIIVTRNKKDFPADEALKVLTPEEFLTVMLTKR